MKFQVTQQDIDDANEWRKNRVAGSGWKSKNCPIARCLHRNGFPEASVGPVRICLDEIGARYTLLPHTAKRFVRNYDDGFLVDPFSFEIDVEVQ